MQTKINNLPDSNIEIEFQLSPEEFEKFEKEALFEIGKDFEVDGFRKGKVPEKIILEHLGEEKIMSEAINIAIQKSFSEAISNYNLEIISKPEASIIKIAKGNPFQFKIKACVIPKINLPDYKEIAKKVEKKKITVEKNEIEESLKWVQKSRAILSPKDSPAEKGDFVEIEYSISKTEKYKDGFVLGQGSFMDGFEEALLGMSNGEEKKEVKTKTKEGKDVLADIKLISVKKIELPELTDEFVKTLGNFEGLENFKKNIEEGLKIEKEKAELQRMRTEIIDRIVEKISFDAPKVLKEKEEEALLENFKKGIKENFNLSFEEYIEKTKKDEKEIRKSFSNEAEKKVKGLLILREIGKQEKIDIAEEEVEEETQKILKNYHDIKEIKLTPEEIRVYVKDSLIREKTFKILENCV